MEIVKSMLKRIKSDNIFTLIIVMLFILQTTIVFNKLSDNTKVDNSASLLRAERDSVVIALSRQINKLQAGISQDNNRRWHIVGISKWIKQVNSKLSLETCNRIAIAIVNEAEVQKISPSLICGIKFQLPVLKKRF